MKVALITGGASGIGKATVEKFLKKNIKVACLDYDEEQGNQLQSAYSQEECLFILCDVRKINTIGKAVKQVLEHFKTLNIIVINAGIYLQKNILETSESEWDDVIATNLKGAAFTIRAALPYLIKNGGGTIVLIGSDQCTTAKKSSFAYATSKGGIVQMTKSLALDFADKNIRVNAVCPGTIKTPMIEKLVKQWADREYQGDVQHVWQLIKKDYPVGRIGTPEEVAELIYFLTTEKASFITGSLYSIDGGLTI